MTPMEHDIIRAMGLALIKAFSEDKWRKLEKWNKYRKKN